MCKLGKDVCLPGLLGQEGNADEASMGCLDLGFVGKLDKYSIVGRNAFGAGIVDVQEVACASCVGNSVLVCGWRTVVERSGANVVATMISLI